MSEEAEKAKVEEKAEAAPPADTLGPNEVNIVTTAPGSFGPEGIAAIGTHRVLNVKSFSAAWMRPKGMADRNKLTKAGKL